MQCVFDHGYAVVLQTHKHILHIQFLFTYFYPLSLTEKLHSLCILCAGICSSFKQSQWQIATIK